MPSPRRSLTTPALHLELLEDRLPPGDLGFAGLLSLPQVLFALVGSELVPETPALTPDAGTQTQAVASLPDTASQNVGLLEPRREAPAVVPATPPADDRQLADVLEAPAFDDFGDGATIQSLLVGPNLLTHDREGCSGMARGRVQSETTVAVHNFMVVVGFNDFRGFSCPSQGPGYQVTGWAYSPDGGESFFEGGPLPGRTALRGDPWLAVGPDGTFYFASLHNSGMAVLRGTVDEATGLTWSEPTIISQGGSHDKEAMAVDQNNGNIYLTYTRFGGPGGIAAFRSLDGGLTFQGPVTVNPGVGQGSFPVVGPNGEVYVAWNIGYPSNTGIGFGMSTDFGQTFNTGRQIASVCNFLIPGFDRGTHPLLPTMAVDLSGGAYHGTIYVAFATACGGNGDVVLVRSGDGGKTWSDPITINDDGTTGIQWYPSVTVDILGNVNVFFYDRREDPGTTITNLYFAQSQDGGDTFTNVKVTDVPSTWTTGGGESPNYGDYINSTTWYTDALVAYADGRDGDPDTYFTRVSLVK